MKQVSITFLIATVLSTMIFVAKVGAVEKAKPAAVGTETCVGCHEGKKESIGQTKHAIIFQKNEKNPMRGCETCHGAGGAHVDDQEANVLNFAKKANPEAGSAACLKCHRKGEANAWDTSKHAEEGLNCVNCHQMHGGKTEKQLKKTQTEVCAECHKEKASEILMPGRHPVKEGKINCSSCHSPHGSAQLSTEGGSLVMKCVDCHQEKAGPFRYEHEPATESCANCHTVHGSVNKHLTQFKQPALCLQCHTGEHMLQSGALLKGDCTQCHTAQHGSNLDDKLLR